MHPFDIEAALLAKHAQHVVLIHFPIALFLAGVAFDVLAARTRRNGFAAAAYYNLAAAALSTLPVVVTGLLAWQLLFDGRKLKGLLLLHLCLALVSSVLLVAVWWMHRRGRRAAGETGLPSLPPYRWPLEALAVACIALTGHLGGFLSGVNLPG